MCQGLRLRGRENVGRNKLAQFRQPYGKRTVAMPELRKLVPAYGPVASGAIMIFGNRYRRPLVISLCLSCLFLKIRSNQGSRPSGHRGNWENRMITAMFNRVGNAPRALTGHQ